MDGRRAKQRDISGTDVMTWLLWVFAAAALAWGVESLFGEKESADALIAVMFAIVLVMINQVVSWQRARARRTHDEQIKGLLVEIRNELKKTNGMLTKRKPSQRRRP